MTFFSIIVPFHNALESLTPLLDSILSQHYSDCEVIVVDDCSTSCSSSDVRSLLADFPITTRYYSIDKGHKKSAVNHGVKNIDPSSDLIAVLDDDDLLYPGILHVVSNLWSGLPPHLKSNLSGITCNSVDENGCLVGTLFPSDIYIGTELGLRRQGVKGDKFNFKRSDIMKLYPYPQSIPGYVPESIVWNLIEVSYSSIYINTIGRIYDQSRQFEKKRNPARLKRSTAPGRLLESTMVLQNFYFYRFPSYILRIILNWYRFVLHMFTSRNFYRPSHGFYMISFLLLPFAPIGVSLYIYDLFLSFSRRRFMF